MRRPIVFFLLAGFAAVLAAIVVYSALKKKDAEVERATVKSTPIVVAAHDLSLGSKIDEASIRLVRWPKDNVPPGAAGDPHAFLGSIVKTSFVENEPIVSAKLFQGDKAAGVLPLLIPAGLRAMSVPVDEVSDIAGFVLPHSRVDVLVALATHGQGANSEENRSKIVLENVEVLAVAQTVEQKEDQPQVVKVVTLLVTPEEAERLALASREGTLRLAMRNYADDKLVLTSGTDIQGMLHAYSSIQAPALQFRHRVAAPPQAVKPFEVEILRNGQTREQMGFTPAGRQHGGAHEAAPVTPEPRESASAQASAQPADPSVASFGPAGKTIDVH